MQIEIRRLKIEGTPRGKGKKKKEGVEEMGDDDDCNYLFMCNRWFAKDEDDKQIVRELVPTDATGTRARSGSLPSKYLTCNFYYVIGLFLNKIIWDILSSIK